MTEPNPHNRATPTCPHCGHAQDTDDMLLSKTDLFALAPAEESACIVCPACDQEFWVKGGYTPHYTSAFSEEEL